MSSLTSIGSLLRGGRPALVSDAELVALAVAQAAIVISSDRQFPGLIGGSCRDGFRGCPSSRSTTGGCEAWSI
jgi:hypothetical protein